MALARFEDAPSLVGPERADHVLAADVLYRHENAELLLDVLPRFLRPGGEAWIADPGRSGWERFRRLARRRWRIASALDSARPQAWVHRLALRRG